MALPIEDYALIGDSRTAALVGKDGSIDWLCFPRFDSRACFAGLLGTPENGRWLIAPAEPVRSVKRRYRPGTLVLETEFTTDSGCARIVDFMPPHENLPNLVRIVEGVRGTVPMFMQLVIRFDYGSAIPWVRRTSDGLTAIAGPDALLLRTPVRTRGQDLTTVAEFRVDAGHYAPFTLSWFESHEQGPEPLDPQTELLAAECWWREWCARCTYRGPYWDAVVGSLLVLKALTYLPTGGIVAAPTTSLPEMPGGVRNWDYRYCWLRDATLTLYALLLAGYADEAEAWREWLLRAVAGDPANMRILYGLRGERLLSELSLPWLAGYDGAAPVRLGNAAAHQFQLDVYGEVMDTLFQARRAGLGDHRWTWQLQTHLMDFLESSWHRADHGIWEIRGSPQHFTHSRIMSWVAFDRAVKAVEHSGLPGPVERWRWIRQRIFAEIIRKGYDAQQNTFTQYYGTREVDASLLVIPQVGFLPPTDPRVIGTVEAIERKLLRDGFVRRYLSDGAPVDGLPPGEGTFIACTFWLADAYDAIGRREDAVRTFERLLAIRNDVGLLAEEFDPRTGHQLGNFPQALSHLALVNTALNLQRDQPGPAQQRPAP